MITIPLQKDVEDLQLMLREWLDRNFIHGIIAQERKENDNVLSHT